MNFRCITRTKDESIKQADKIKDGKKGKET
jgi:hypothetical protein